MTTPKNATAIARRDSATTLKELMRVAGRELRAIAPKYVSIPRLLQLALEARQRNPLLADCSVESVIGFCKTCAEHGTDRIGPGGMWPVPFRNRKTGRHEMTPIPDWRLLIEKARQAGVIKHARAEVVYHHDEFGYELGLNPVLTHKPVGPRAGKIRAAYVVFTLPDGSKDFCVMDYETEIVPIRNRSQAWQAYQRDAARVNPWVTDEAEMCKKTAVKRGIKPYEGAVPEITKLIALDNSVVGYAEGLQIEPPIAEPRELPPETETPEPPETETPEPPETEETEPAETATPKPAPENDDADLFPPEDQAPPEPPRARKAPPKTARETLGVIAQTKMAASAPDAEKPWTRYGARIGSDWYGTFDEQLGNALFALEGRRVRLRYNETARGFKNIVAVEPDEENEGP